MTNQKPTQAPPMPRIFAITEEQLAALQTFVGSLKLSWAETNPYMGLLASLPEVKVEPPPDET